MVNYLEKAYLRYEQTLRENGYIKADSMRRLLIMQFICKFLFDDYRPCLSEEEYDVVDRAMNCLFGSSCLTPYYDYSQVMGKLVERYRNQIKICEDNKLDPDTYVVDLTSIVEDIRDNAEHIKQNEEMIDKISDITIVVPAEQ